jgi:hypothetical protein
MKHKRKERKNTGSNDNARHLGHFITSFLSVVPPPRLPLARTHQPSPIRAVARSGEVWCHGHCRLGLRLVWATIIVSHREKIKIKLKLTYGPADIDISWAPSSCSPFISLSPCVVPVDRTHLAIPIAPVIVIIFLVVVVPIPPACTPQVVTHSGGSGCCCRRAMESG